MRTLDIEKEGFFVEIERERIGIAWAGGS